MGSGWTALLFPCGTPRVPGVARIPPDYLPDDLLPGLAMVGYATAPDAHDLGAHCPGRYGAGMERMHTR